MNVVVCVKQVPDTHIPIEIDTHTGLVNSDDFVYVINPCDQAAVEEAVQLKEEGIASQVTLLSLGMLSAASGLRNCLALGADRAILVKGSAFTQSDSYATAVALARAIAHMPYDLILCGARAADTNAGLVGAVIAESLDLPLVSEVTRINVSPQGNMVVHRKLEKGNREVVEVDRPALLTMDIDARKTRYASLTSLIAAQRKEIEEFDLKALGLSPVEVGPSGSKLQIHRFSPPKPRRKKLFTPDAKLSSTQRIDQIMTGGMTEKKAEILEGDPNTVASRLIRLLAQQKLAGLGPELKSSWDKII